MTPDTATDTTTAPKTSMVPVVAIIPTRLRRLVCEHPLISYFILAYALTWWVYPLLQISPLLGLAGLFGPALAAIVMAAVSDGKAGIKSLLGRTVRWRIGLPWYVVALGLPALLSLTTAALAVSFGVGSLQLGQLSVLDLALFILVVGEELGWRGYALPKLLETRSVVTASIILGVLWGLWHLPGFFTPAAPQQGLPIIAFALMTIGYSIILSWIYVHTRGSVLIATLCHGAINLSQGFFLGGVDGSTRYWLLAAVYGVAAVAVAVVLRARSTRDLSGAESVADSTPV